MNRYIIFVMFLIYLNGFAEIPVWSISQEWEGERGGRRRNVRTIAVSNLHKIKITVRHTKTNVVASTFHDLDLWEFDFLAIFLRISEVLTAVINHMSKLLFKMSGPWLFLETKFARCFMRFAHTSDVQESFSAANVRL